MEIPYSDTNAGLHYDLRLDIQPQRQSVAVAGSIAYHSPKHRLERARFFLHRQFDVIRLEGRRVFGYHFETGGLPPVPFLPQAGVLDVYFDPPLRKHEVALIQFEYQGTITDWPAESTNIITPDWAELGMYLPWFPYQHQDSPSNLTFTLKVVCTPGYQVGSLGKFEQMDGAWYFNWPHPTDDIVVTAGRNLETHLFESETSHVYVTTNTFKKETARRLGEDTLWTLERFSGWFGPIRPAELTLIESPRAFGGGYARRGLVVLGGLNEQDYLNQREAYFRYLAHEAAHAWWWQAPTDSWEDWLNESMAEYSALLALRERFGNEVFEKYLDIKRNHMPNGIPLWGFSRNNLSTPEKQTAVERMLYDKGPLLLHELAQRIGNQRFLELCRGMLWSGVTETSHMLELLEELEDQETRLWMETSLKKE